MALTHKRMKEQKKQKIDVKEDDPRYKTYSKAEAVAANKKLREDKRKVAEYQESLKKGKDPLEDKKEDAGDAGSGSDDQSNLSPEVQEKIKALKAEKVAAKGPGSKAKKEAIQKKIDELKAGGDSNDGSN